MDKIVIYDTETTNSTIWGSIIEVGAVVVDKNLKEIGKLNIRGRMPEGEVPSAKALLVNSTSIDLLTKGNYSHYEYFLTSITILNSKKYKIKQFPMVIKGRQDGKSKMNLKHIARSIFFTFYFYLKLTLIKRKN